MFANAISMNLDELGRSIFTAGQSHLDHLIFFRRTVGTCSHSDHLVFFHRTLGTCSHSHHLVFFRRTLGTWKKARWSEWDGPWRRRWGDLTQRTKLVFCILFPVKVYYVMHKPSHSLTSVKASYNCALISIHMSTNASLTK